MSSSAIVSSTGRAPQGGIAPYVAVAVLLAVVYWLWASGMAEEAVQLTFLKTWQAADRLRLDAPLSPWVYAIARRTAIDLYRREARHSTVGLDHEPEMVALSATFEDLWEIWQVRSAVDLLPPDEQQIVEAVHFRGQSLREVAEELGIPLGTVKSRINRGRLELAKLLKRRRAEWSPTARGRGGEA